MSVMQMFLERRLKGPCVAAHAVYHDEQYFKAVTGLTNTKWIECKRTETTVRYVVGNMPDNMSVVLISSTSTLALQGVP